MDSFRLASSVAPGPSPRGAPGRPRGAPRRPPGSPGAPRVHAAHPVPWRVVARSDRGEILVENAGGQPLRAARVSLAGAGLLGLSLPRTVLPGERLRVVLRGGCAGDALAAPDAMLVLRWFQPDGTELLWPIAL